MFRARAPTGVVCRFEGARQRRVRYRGLPRRHVRRRRASLHSLALGGALTPRALPAAGLCQPNGPPPRRHYRRRSRRPRRSRRSRGRADGPRGDGPRAALPGSSLPAQPLGGRHVCVLCGELARRVRARSDPGRASVAALAIFRERWRQPRRCSLAPRARRAAATRPPRAASRLRVPRHARSGLTRRGAFARRALLRNGVRVWASDPAVQAGARVRLPSRRVRFAVAL